MDISGLILLAFALITLILGLVEGDAWGWGFFKNFNFILIVDVLLLMIFWFIEHKVNSPLVHFYHFHKHLLQAM